MLRSYPVYDHLNIIHDREPKWTDFSTEDIDLGVLPPSLEEMDRQAESSSRHYTLKHPMPQGLQSLDQQLPVRSHSPLDAPTAWSENFPPPGGHRGASCSSSYGLGSLSVPSSLKIPDTVPHPPSWHGSGAAHDFDAPSTIDPGSPMTPASRSDIDVKVVPQSDSSWASGHTNSTSHHRGSITDFKQERLDQYPSHGGVSLPQIQPHPHYVEDRPPPPYWHPPSIPSGSGPEHHSHWVYQSGQLPSHEGHNPSYHTMDRDLREVAGTVSPSALQPHGHPAMVEAEQEEDDNNDMEDAPGESDDEDYSPNVPPHTTGRRNPKRTQTKGTQSRTKRQQTRQTDLTKPQTDPNYRISKTHPSSQPTSSLQTPRDASSLTCSHCHKHFQSPSTLTKHTLTTHTRPFICIFRRYGCPQTFGSKNEWSRHIKVQHLRLEVWRCDIDKCAPNHGHHAIGTEEKERSPHDFDRKDLFTQHLRRMHQDLYTKSYLNAHFGGTKAQLESHVQQRCHLVLRQTPSGTLCPYCDNGSPVPRPRGQIPAQQQWGQQGTGINAFDTWENMLEHLARHLEKGEAEHMNLGEEDLGLREWLIDEGLLKWRSEERGAGGVGGYRIVGCEGKKSNTAATATVHSAGGGKRQPGRSARGRRRTQIKEEEEEEEEDEDADADYEY